MEIRRNDRPTSAPFGFETLPTRRLGAERASSRVEPTNRTASFTPDLRRAPDLRIRRLETAETSLLQMSDLLANVAEGVQRNEQAGTERLNGRLFRGAAVTAADLAERAFGPTGQSGPQMRRVMAVYGAAAAGSDPRVDALLGQIGQRLRGDSGLVAQLDALTASSESSAASAGLALRRMQDDVQQDRASVTQLRLRLQVEADRELDVSA